MGVTDISKGVYLSDISVHSSTRPLAYSPTPPTVPRPKPAWWHFTRITISNQSLAKYYESGSTHTLPAPHVLAIMDGIEAGENMTPQQRRIPYLVGFGIIYGLTDATQRMVDRQLRMEAQSPCQNSAPSNR